MTPERLAALLLPWLARGPAYAGLASGVRGLVLDGRLPAGARVPSERALAATAGLSRTTVSAAYDVLRSQGYLTSARGAGSRASLPATAAQRPDGDPSGWPAEGPEVVADLTVAALPAPPQLVEAVERAVRALPRELAGPGLHPLGLAALREGVAAHLTGRGLTTTADQVLVTGGALAGWDLLLRTLTRPGERVLVEQPTYPGVLDAVTAQQRRPVALPVSAQGWDQPPRGSRTSLAHVTPDGQNPTGLVATTEQRAALLASLAATPGAPRVAVDESFADLVLDGAVPVRTATLDPRVVTLGSLNKLVWPGLRTGWLRADAALVARLARARGGGRPGQPRPGAARRPGGAGRRRRRARRAQGRAAACARRAAGGAAPPPAVVEVHRAAGRDGALGGAADAWFHAAGRPRPGPGGAPDPGAAVHPGRDGGPVGAPAADRGARAGGRRGGPARRGVGPGGGRRPRAARTGPLDRLSVARSAQRPFRAEAGGADGGPERAAGLSAAALKSHGNGRIPPAALESIGGGERLWAPAAQAFTKMREAARAQGVTFGVNDSYRSFDEQVDMVRRKGLHSQGGLAATPGTSDHRWGKAVDLQLDGRAQQWMRANGERFGFAEDTPREPWHWGFKGGPPHRPTA